MAVVRRPTSSSGGSLLRSYKVYLPLLLMMLGLYLYKPDLSITLPESTEAKSLIAVLNPDGDDEEGVRPRLGAYYYNWYNKDQWDHWKTKYTPELGLYDSSNDTVITQHSKWATRAGVDFFVMSYAHNVESITKYLEHPDSFPIALHVESLALYEDAVRRYNKKMTGKEEFAYSGFMDFNAPAISKYKPDKVTTFGEVYSEAMYKAMSEIFRPYRPKYTKVSNRPIFVVYLARDFKNYEHHIKEMRNKITKKFNMQPYLIADSVWFDDDLDRKATHDKSAGSCWDSLTAYNRYEGLRNENLRTYMQRIEYEFELYAQKSNPWFWESRDNRMTMLPYVQPMYDDTLIRADIHPENAERSVYPYDGGTTYEKFWDLAKRIIDRNPCDNMHTDEHFVFISSFNEWHESTAIEPSKEFGNHLLHVTRERSRYMNMQCDPLARRQMPRLKTKHELRGN